MAKKPDYNVMITRQRTSDDDKPFNTKIGAGWVNKAGGINVTLNPGLSLVISDRVAITLWPPKDDDRPASKPSTDDSDIPF
jgi:hypothetical protein